MQLELNSNQLEFILVQVKPHRIEHFHNQPNYEN